MNLKIARLVLNAKYKIACSRRVHVSDGFGINRIYIVHLVAYIYMLKSNEEISKIEKTYL